MQSNENLGKHPTKLFLPAELADFDIPWGKAEEEWLKRFDKVKNTSACDSLLHLSLYWKFAWNTARCPWLMADFVQQVTKVPNMAQRVWNEMQNNSESQLTIIGTQVLAYSGLYFAYEKFVTSCYVAKTGDESRRLFGYFDIRDALIEAFGELVESQVWSSEKIERIRHVRNDLAHSGGDPGQRTKELAQDMILEGEHIFITPNDVKEAFSELKNAVDVLLDQGYPAR